MSAPIIYGPLRILTDWQRNRLVELIDIFNTATQIDYAEAVEFRELLTMLEETPISTDRMVI